MICTITNGNSVIVATNDGKTSPRYKRTFSDGNISYAAHAEMRALSKMPRSWDPRKVRVHVQRFKKDGTLAMSKPCVDCQARLWQYGVEARRVTFTNHEGLQERFNGNRRD